MKPFVRKFLYIILPIIPLMFLLDAFLSHNLKHCYSSYQGEMQVWDDIYSGRIKDDCFIYGSSRSWVHIDPLVIEDVTGVTGYNMGMDGQKMELQLFRHEQLMKYAHKPKYIIFSLDLTSLTKREGLYLKEQFLPYMLWNKEVKDATSSFQGFSAYDYEIPLWRYAGDFKSIGFALASAYKPKANPVRVKGYRGSHEKWNNDFERARASMESYKVDIDTTAVRLFKDFIHYCKKEDIKLIFVITPQYIEGQNFVENKAEVMSLYDKWSKEYDIPYFEYLSDSICYDSNYFYNATHMNITGSQLFSRKMANDLKPYLKPDK